MRIVCPSCQAVYEVPDKLLSGPAKRVRCARCGVRMWHEPLASTDLVFVAAGTLDDPNWAVPACPSRNDGRLIGLSGGRNRRARRVNIRTPAACAGVAALYLPLYLLLPGR